jgi:hypothetical protein
MANPIVRSISFYANNKKVSQQETVAYSGTDHGEEAFGDVPGGFMTYTQGAVTTEIQMTEIIPVPGSDFDFVSALINHTPLTAALSIVDGNIHQISVRCMEYKFDSDVQKGSLKGSFTFRGGGPAISGA